MKRTPLRRKKAMARTRKQKKPALVWDAQWTWGTHATMGQMIRNAQFGVPSAVVRRPLPRVGSRSKREKAELEIMRGVALDRAGGKCERCGKRAALDVHHIIPKGRGVGWPGLNTPGNAAAICRFPCHEALTLEPLAVLDHRGELGTRAEIVWKMFQAWRAASGKES